MIEALMLAYPWLKAAHILFVIFWMAGLFMLPRMFVYHQESAVGSPEDKAWIAREERIASIILNPAMLIVWVLGLSLAYVTDAWMQGWFIAKLALVIGLSGYQGWLMRYRAQLAAGARPLSGRALRMLNELPGLAAVLIVILVVIRPFA
ncbi:MAG: CopD family protein [Sphingomonadaceae bacterium]|nr:CopD family protein [Sphingomonadaceae bacterium]